MGYGSFPNVTGQQSAQENAEIRGWITRDDGICDSEWRFNLLLDVGWMPSNQSVWALYNIDRIVPLMPPTNLSMMAPWTLSGGYGGYMAPVVHVEVDAWGQYRSGSDFEAPGRIPSGWTFKTTAANNCLDQTPGTHLYWPFPLGNVDSNGNLISSNFQVGDYVRVVGTLWLDNDAGHSQGNQQATCWENTPVSRNLGTLEMHPVDFMDRLCPPVLTNSSWHTVAGYAACMSTTGTLTVSDSFSIGTSNYANASSNLTGPYYPPNSTYFNEAEQISSSLNFSGTFSFYGTLTPPSSQAMLYAWYDMYNTCNGACACKAGYANVNGQCTYQCNSTTCASGCCSGGTCSAGTATSACGSGGATCQSCSGYQTCGGGGTAQVCGCTPTTSCASAGYSCGSLADGCGNTLSCGSCPSGYSCTSGRCQPPTCPTGYIFCDPGCYKQCP